MARALEMAERAWDQGEVPVGAVVVSDGIEIAGGFNLREKLQSPLAHAEITALEKAAKALGTWRLSECELYVTLEPCPMCLAVLQQARIGRVVYGAKDAKGGALSLKIALNKHPKLTHRFAVEFARNQSCEDILKQFFKSTRTRAV